ncbi:hypothetical protein O6H91_Y204300 [Diphasiastrum complanatum]|nr:hypothetical protein O6H91_Y204300 [Diphasiastrum complanatum]
MKNLTSYTTLKQVLVDAMKIESTLLAFRDIDSESELDEISGLLSIRGSRLLTTLMQNNGEKREEQASPGRNDDQHESTDQDQDLEYDPKACVAACNVMLLQRGQCSYCFENHHIANCPTKKFRVAKPVVARKHQNFQDLPLTTSKQVEQMAHPSNSSSRDGPILKIIGERLAPIVHSPCASPKSMGAKMHDSPPLYYVEGPSEERIPVYAI